MRPSALSCSRQSSATVSRPRHDAGTIAGRRSAAVRASTEDDRGAHPMAAERGGHTVASRVNDAPQTLSADGPPRGGTGLLLIVSGATIFTVAAEAAFMHWASWALLPVIVATILLVAAVVVAAVGRLVDDGELAASPIRAAAPETEPAPVRGAGTPVAAGRVAIG